MIREQIVFQSRDLSYVVSLRMRNGGGNFAIPGSYQLNLRYGDETAAFCIATVGNGRLAVDTGQSKITVAIPAAAMFMNEGYGTAELLRVDGGTRVVATWPLRFVLPGTPFLDRFATDLVIYENDLMLGFDQQMPIVTWMASGIPLSTRAEAMAFALPVAQSHIYIAGYTTAGDGGGGLYKLIGAAPGSIQPYHFQNAVNSQWYELAEINPYLEHFGGKDNVTSPGFDNSAALAAARVYGGVGGKVRGRARTYCFTTHQNFNDEGAALVGDTSGQFVFNAENSQGFVLKYTGAVDGIAVSIGTLGTSGSVSGALIDNVTIDGNNLASFCLLNRNVDDLGVGDVKLVNPRSTNAGAYAYFCDSSSASTGGFSGCNFRTHIKRLTISVSGVANGARFTGKAATNGSNVTFLNGDQIHVTFQNGVAYDVQKADSINFQSITGSRMGGNVDGSANAGAPATGDFMRLGGSGDTAFWVIGNRFGFLHCGKTDGTNPVIRLRDARVICNDLGMLSGTDNGLQVVLEGGAKEPCYHNTGEGYSNDLATLGAYEVADPHRIRGYETNDPTLVNMWSNVQAFTPVFKINGSSAGITQSFTASHWRRFGNEAKIWIIGSISTKAGTGNLTFDWALGAGAPPAALSGLSLPGLCRPVTGFTSGVIDRPLLPILATNVVTLLKTSAGAGGMSNMTDADIAATMSIAMEITYKCG